MFSIMFDHFEGVLSKSANYQPPLLLAPSQPLSLLPPLHSPTQIISPYSTSPLATIPMHTTNTINKTTSPDNISDIKYTTTAVTYFLKLKLLTPSSDYCITCLFNTRTNIAPAISAVTDQSIRKIYLVVGFGQAG
ncbi:unnamed protein product [Meganyctiphanes norvegica]|uniref:Uncharacterized protein n=1 Tax=Meganyctiphanes norvegica TaxID=48144 RepID=A0AAV2QR55_MEGNR